MYNDVPLSVSFSDIYMVKIRSNIVLAFKWKFYRKYVHDMFNRRKVKTNDIPFWKIKNYHPKLS